MLNLKISNKRKGSEIVNFKNKNTVCTYLITFFSLFLFATILIKLFITLIIENQIFLNIQQYSFVNVSIFLFFSFCLILIFYYHIWIKNLIQNLCYDYKDQNKLYKISVGLLTFYALIVLLSYCHDLIIDRNFYDVIIRGTLLYDNLKQICIKIFESIYPILNKVFLVRLTLFILPLLTILTYTYFIKGMIYNKVSLVFQLLLLVIGIYFGFIGRDLAPFGQIWFLPDYHNLIIYIYDNIDIPYYMKNIMWYYVIVYITYLILIKSFITIKFFKSFSRIDSKVESLLLITIIKYLEESKGFLKILQYELIKYSYIMLAGSLVLLIKDNLGDSIILFIELLAFIKAAVITLLTAFYSLLLVFSLNVVKDSSLLSWFSTNQNLSTNLKISIGIVGVIPQLILKLISIIIYEGGFILIITIVVILKVLLSIFFIRLLNDINYFRNKIKSGYPFLKYIHKACLLLLLAFILYIIILTGELYITGLLDRIAHYSELWSEYKNIITVKLYSNISDKDFKNIYENYFIKQKNILEFKSSYEAPDEFEGWIPSFSFKMVLTAHELGYFKYHLNFGKESHINIDRVFLFKL